MIQSKYRFCLYDDVTPQKKKEFFKEYEEPSTNSIVTRLNTPHHLNDTLASNTTPIKRGIYSRSELKRTRHVSCDSENRIAYLENKAEGLRRRL
jgi:hypothetical protein